MFGFFDCEQSQDTAAALVEAVTGWLRERGRDRLLGPMDFTTNDECGLLVEGFDVDPMILEPWHPPYYQELLEGLGMTKSMDLLMWKLAMGQLKQGNQFHDLIHQAAEASRSEHGVTVRNMRKRDLEAEIQRFMEVYNEAWGRNWGFVPITEEEVAFQARNLKPILMEEWGMIAERNGEVVGAALTLPDINQALVHMKGRLLPFGWWHFLRRRRYMDRVRVFALGVKPSYQHLGVAAALFVRHIEVAPRVGMMWGDQGWILEVNKPMNRAMEGMGGEIVKRYRLYERPIAPA
jgi:GNAT superfamily N-acetyltransferase